MASKLLNVRMDEEMLKDLKEVCGELGINVTDAIKSFSKELIEKKKLPTESKEEIKDIETFLKWADERNETCGDNEGYERMNEEISDILLSCHKDLRSFIAGNLFTYRNQYQELAKKFKEEYGEEFKDRILDVITNFYEIYYKEMIDTHGPIHDAEEKFQQEKYISVMQSLKEKNLKLYNELLNDYSYNLSPDNGISFSYEGYFEVKKILEELLTVEEIKEYVKYINEISNFEGKPREELENFKNNIPDERWEILSPILDKVSEYIHKKTKQESEEILKRWEEEKKNK